MNRILLLSLIALFSVSSFASTSFSIMSYNLENLFDTEHDEGKNDYTYLPMDVKNSDPRVKQYCDTQTGHYKKECEKLNYTQTIFNKKIENLSQAIKAYNNGQGADILVFVEVENVNVLNLLRDQGLANLGYQYITLIEGPDKRGIDVGMISRFPVIKSKLHHIPVMVKKPSSKVPSEEPTDTNSENVPMGRETRGILEAKFDINGNKVTVFGNHWPSQNNPSEARMKAAQVLYDNAALVTDSLVVAVGDFNTIESEKKNGLKEILFKQDNGRDFFIDAKNQTKPNYPGTHFFGGSWAHLDRILVLNSSLRFGNPNWDSFYINAEPFLLKPAQIKNPKGSKESKNIKGIESDKGSSILAPFRWNPNTGEGFSDHLGVSLVFNL